MDKHNVQDWLKTKVRDDPEVILAGKLEYLRLYLTDVMRELRRQAGLTQAQLAEKLGVQQAAVSKLESALKNHEFESVLHYLHTLGADLLVAVKQGEELYPVSDSQGVVLVDVPGEVQELAKAEGMNVREYVQEAILQFSQKAASVIEAVTVFLESNDPVAVRVRERLGDKPLSAVAAELEKYLSIPEEDEQIFAIKVLLAGGIRSGEITRDTSEENDAIELLDLAESLLDKLVEIKLKDSH